MPRNPVATYRALLRRAMEVLELPDEATTRSRLYTALKPGRLAENPALQAVLDELGIGAGYARNHLLSLGGWPEDVVTRVEEGLPLAVARSLAALDHDLRGQALASAKRDRHGTWGQRVGRAIDRVRREAAAPDVLPEDGWLPPSPSPVHTPAPSGDVWRFPTLGRAGREAEELHPDLARAILARYAEPGDAVVDLTAGSGTVALAAREHGCRSWSGDIAPRLPFVHRMDATDVRMVEGLAPACADIAFLHPPTYFAWLRDRPAGSVEGREGYAALIAEMVVSAVPLLREGGHLVLIGRPVRADGVVHTAIGELQRELEEAGTVLVGYHLGVDERASEDWHVLVGRLCGDSPVMLHRQARRWIRSVHPGCRPTSSVRAKTGGASCPGSTSTRRLRDSDQWCGFANDGWLQRPRIGVDCGLPASTTLPGTTPMPRVFVREGFCGSHPQHSHRTGSCMSASISREENGDPTAQVEIRRCTAGWRMRQSGIERSSKQSSIADASSRAHD